MKKTIQLLAIIIVMICTSVKVNAQCNIFVGPNQSFCCGPAVAQLTAAISSTYCNCTNYSYVWTPTVGLNNPYIANPTATLNGTQVYTVCITAYRKASCTASCCTVCGTVTISVNGSCCRTTGLDENTKNSAEIQTYPNPSTNNLTVDVLSPLNNADIMLQDVTGRVIWQKNNVTGKNKFDVNVAEMPRGIYFIIAKQDGKEVYNNKVILE